uniref:Serine aminopeptidase S33 domain-containing protein n=1 Tax=Oryza nivara TaxID=4536 RepID=A0A0E0FL03_ORYNI
MWRGRRDVGGRALVDGQQDDATATHVAPRLLPGQHARPVLQGAVEARPGGGEAAQHHGPSARRHSSGAPPVCREVQSRFQEVELPLLVVHGGDDTLCDPECAEELHRRAGSEDKTLRVYPGMWHQLVGEPEENVDKVFGDVLDWFKSHAAATAATPGEGQQ